MFLYSNNILIPDNKWLSGSDLLDLQVYLNYDTDSKLTVLMYDLDTPQPFIHLLVSNISNNDITTGDVLIKYRPPNPPGVPHRYIVGIFAQYDMILIRNFNSIDDFITNNNLQLIDSKGILFDPANDIYHTFDLSEYNESHPLINSDTTLSDQQQKFCSCLVEVASNQPDKCNKEKAWFQERDGRKCYNPAAVCASSVGTTSRNCYENYNYIQFTPNQLQQTMNLKFK